MLQDDGWSAHRNATDGKIIPDPKRWPTGIKDAADYVHSRGLRFGLYSSASSVVCSGRPGSLFNEDTDAQSFAEWGIDFLKYDNCARK